MQLQIRKRDNRIIGYSTSGLIEGDDYYVEDYDGEIDETKIYWSIYENGKIVFHQELLDEEIAQADKQEMMEQQEAMLAKMQRQTTLRALPDIQAYSVRLLFDEWTTDYPYLLDDRCVFENKFYKCLKEHTSNETLKPSLANYLWVEIANPSEEWPEWKQPLGYADAYSKGDKVTFNSKKYESLIDGNVYSPVDYPAGWNLIE